mmetsp:Transcript_12278/g.38463  ORF Transcript_12278/g.38463 Transcript_12278/m.38463 type:complete len:275 (+) Transcript_12278:407-1231(+)
MQPMSMRGTLCETAQAHGPLSEHHAGPTDMVCFFSCNGGLPWVAVRHLEGPLGAIVDAGLGLPQHRLAHPHVQRVLRGQGLCKGDGFVDAACFRGAITMLSRAHSGQCLVVADTTDMQLGQRVEGQFRGLRHENVGRADKHISDACGLQWVARSKDREGLRVVAPRRKLHGRFEAAMLNNGDPILLQGGEDRGVHALVIPSVHRDAEAPRQLAGQAGQPPEQAREEPALRARAAHGEEEAPAAPLGRAVHAPARVLYNVRRELLGDEVPHQTHI